MSGFWGQLYTLHLGFKDAGKKEVEKLFQIRRINNLLELSLFVIIIVKIDLFIVQWKAGWCGIIFFVSC